MLHTPTDPDVEESGCNSPPPPSTNSLTPQPGYLVRSNLPGLSLEIENPDTELPVVSFDFEMD
jgi:hypothetical protein